MGAALMESGWRSSRPRVNSAAARFLLGLRTLRLDELLGLLLLQSFIACEY
jgi:hypothetical protein